MIFEKLVLSEGLVLSNGYVYYSKAAGEIISVTGIANESNFGTANYTFRVRWSKDDSDYLRFKSKRSCSYNRNKLLKWIDEVERKGIEDIDHIESKVSGD